MDHADTDTDTATAVETIETTTAAKSAAAVAAAAKAAATNLIAEGNAAAEGVHEATVKAAKFIVSAAAKAATELDRLEEHLRQARKMETVGELAGGIAHDFNNLLTVISGFTELVMTNTDSTDSRYAELVEIQKAAERASTWTRQLLALSRRQVLQPRVLDVNALLTNMQALLQQTLRDDITLVVALGDIPPVRIDAGQLEQVLLNLVLNARDAMPDGGELRVATQTVTVNEAWRHPPLMPGQYLRLTVSDTGVGMSPETQARIFEPFFTTKPFGRGTGLGLATTYGIVSQSGGVLDVESQVGHGASFAIYFPAVDAAVEPPVPVFIAEVAAGGSETILLAEDDNAVRGLVRHTLVESGYTVLQGFDGDDALAVARQHVGVIHLLVTDVMMPRLNGPALVARIRMERPDIRVLYTSGYADQVTAHAGVGPDTQVLHKPFLPHDLLRRVRGTLDALAIKQPNREH